MKLTIFTPTYNRAYVLGRVYNSMLKQSNKDFEWVIMDDGSTDNTEELVVQWEKEKQVCIKYYKQENQGRFAAFNNVKQYFDGELILWCDSDDELVEDAVELIIDTWTGLQNCSELSGILGYMVNRNYDLIGTEFPTNIKSERMFVLYDKYKLKGDKAVVFRNDLVQKYCYPVFENEKFGGDSLLFNKINDEYPMYLLRNPLVIREYLPDSITNNLLKNHINSANGMREHYKDAILHEKYNKMIYVNIMWDILHMPDLQARGFVEFWMRFLID